MTGRLAESAAAVHTLSTRQFSESCGSGFGRENSVANCFCIAVGAAGASPVDLRTKGEVPSGTCGQLSPYCRASRTPLQGAAGRGGRKRAVPPVGAPYGTPRKRRTPFCSSPRTDPKLVLITGSGAAGLARPRPERETAAAIPALASARVACL